MKLLSRFDKIKIQMGFESIALYQKDKYLVVYDIDISEVQLRKREFITIYTKSLSLYFFRIFFLQKCLILFIAMCINYCIVIDNIIK